MSRDMFFIFLYYTLPQPWRVWFGCIYTYRREVCVARFDGQGNAKASKSETSNRYRFSRFFCFNSSKEYTAESGELIGTRNRTIFLIINYKFYNYAKNKTMADDNGGAIVQHHGKCPRLWSGRYLLQHYLFWQSNGRGDVSGKLWRRLQWIQWSNHHPR